MLWNLNISVSLQTSKIITKIKYTKTVYMQKSYPVIPSRDICDKRILQSYWLKAFLAIIQVQEFPPMMWDLCIKINNKINFYLSMFLAKIYRKIFQNKGKIVLCDHFWAYFLVFTQREFFLKNLAKYNCSGSAASKIQSILAIKPKIIPTLSACKNHSINLLNSSIICNIHLI